MLVRLDMSGQERYRSLASIFTRSADIVAVFFDVTSRQSFLSCEGWMDYIVRGKPCCIVGIGSKIDLADKREVTTEEANSFFGQRGLPYFELSAKTEEGVKETITSILSLWMQCRQPNAVHHSNPS